MAEAEDQVFTSNEESTEDSEDDDSEEEPKLKYERLSNGVTDILQKDAASCMTVHEKFLALGTHNGKVYLLDVQGNVTQKFEILHQHLSDRRAHHHSIYVSGTNFEAYTSYARARPNLKSLNKTKGPRSSEALDYYK